MFPILFAAAVICSCSGGANADVADMNPQFLSITLSDSDGYVIKSISPFDGTVDSLEIAKPLDKVICMSSTTVAAFCEIGEAEVVSGVSGKRYISNETVADSPDVIDVGYESSIDFEAIVEANPDILLYYKVSAVEPQYVVKLKDLGIRVFPLYDNFENHPLARAGYIRFAGALTCKMEVADSIFNAVKDSYLDSVAVGDGKVEVLVNAPYGDAWYVPGKQSYFTTLIGDAGGEILGAEDGFTSSLISLEKAYELSTEADVWLNPGNARTLDQLSGLNPAFKNFLRDGLRVYNNTLRMTPEGGNDFYERGAVRPDLLLKDLRQIFSGEITGLEYYIEVK